ncbi:hypothetical protein GCK72_020874 [Caenorhabditis remanei]|uniref:CUB-like domain-containing protein n=1 Tax=Caenorhabditis remanei TaxID=31234 RepID=A0A6A5GHQ9_CAERE|nr:hypothetical protein GCK72_020874 [Caenorhabditis remanei]KAF1754314.1 hypothetical protein GCK72_020874 [Caenorhabditis remanei]
MNPAILLLFLYGLVRADPQAIFLNKYNADIAASSVAVEAGGMLYLASNDDVASLKMITITNGGLSLTLNQLLNQNGLKLASNQLTIKSTIPSASSATLSGFLYATTAAQANDNTFSVTVVNGGQQFNRAGGQTTTVILNVEFKQNFPPFDAPKRTTYVTGINQFGSTSLNFHHGLPAADYQTLKSNQFFENPQYFDNAGGQEKILFKSVEPMQVNLPYWYITADGPYSMTLDGTYRNVVHNTTSVNTTGVFVLTDVWLPHYVNFVTDPTRKGNTFTLVTTELKREAQVVFTNDESTFPATYAPGNNLIHAFIGSNFKSERLVVNGTDIYPGTMYLQYYVWTGDLLPTTTVPTTVRTSSRPITSTTVATSTKSCNKLKVFLSLLVLVCVI